MGRLKHACLNTLNTPVGPLATRAMNLYGCNSGCSVVRLNSPITSLINGLITAGYGPPRQPLWMLSCSQTPYTIFFFLLFTKSRLCGINPYFCLPRYYIWLYVLLSTILLHNKCLYPSSMEYFFSSSSWHWEYNWNTIWSNKNYCGKLCNLHTSHFVTLDTFLRGYKCSWQNYFLGPGGMKVG